MTRSRRTLRVDALDALLRIRMASVFLERDWELLEEIARLAQEDAPPDMAVTDPAMFATLRRAVTRYHIRGWGNMTPERVREVATRDTERRQKKVSDAG